MGVGKGSGRSTRRKEIFTAVQNVLASAQDAEKEEKRRKEDLTTHFDRYSILSVYCQNCVNTSDGREKGEPNRGPAMLTYCGIEQNDKMTKCQKYDTSYNPRKPERNPRILIYHPLFVYSLLLSVYCMLIRDMLTHADSYRYGRIRQDAKVRSFDLYDVLD